MPTCLRSPVPLPACLVFGICATIATLATSLCGQGGGRAPKREIPWRKDLGAGQLTDPGASRVLPNPRGGDDTGVRLASAERPQRDNTSSTRQDDRWWNEEAERSISHPDQQNWGRGVSPRGEILVSTEILAWVGDQPILAGDLLGRINELLQDAAGELPEEELEKQRWLLMERMLPSAIESKLVYLDFLRNLEKEQVEAVRAGVYKQFDEQQLPQLVKQAKVRGAAELEAKMRVFGSSIEGVRRAFYEQVAAREMIRRKVGNEQEVTHDDLLAYYNDHAAEYDFKAQARWEHLMVRFDGFPSRRAAYDALREMGNSVLGGARLADVARNKSQGPTAADGGRYEWTTQGSLVSAVLDEAIFSLPVGQLSERLVDDDGYHIVRVLERKEAGRVPFLEAQVEIREAIKQERRDVKVREYVERLKRETYVWNRFADSTETAGRESTTRK